MNYNYNCYGWISVFGLEGHHCTSEMFVFASDVDCSSVSQKPTNRLT